MFGSTDKPTTLGNQPHIQEALQSYAVQLQSIHTLMKHRLLTFSLELRELQPVPFHENKAEMEKVVAWGVDPTVLQQAYYAAVQDNPYPEFCHPYPVYGYAALLQKMKEKKELLAKVTELLQTSKEQSGKLKAALALHTQQWQKEYTWRMESIQHKLTLLACRIQEVGIHRGQAQVNHLGLRTLHEQFSKLEKKRAHDAFQSRVNHLCFQLKSFAYEKKLQPQKPLTESVEGDRVKQDLSIVDLQGQLLEMLQAVVKANSKDFQELEASGNAENESQKFPMF